MVSPLGPEPAVRRGHLQGSERAIPRKSSVSRPDLREPHGIYRVNKWRLRGKCWRNSGSRVRCQEVPYSSGTPRGPEILLPQPGLDSPDFFVTLDRKARKTTIFTPRPSGAGDRSRCKLEGLLWEPIRPCGSR